MRILKYILFFVCLLLLGSIGSIAQQVAYTGAVNQTTIQRGGYGADSLLLVPIRDTFCNNFPLARCKGRITMQPSTGNVYAHTGIYWKFLGGTSQQVDSTVFVTYYALSPLP